MDMQLSRDEQHDSDVECQWPLQISSDTRNDWWHDILKRSGAIDRGLRVIGDYTRVIVQALAENDDRDINKLDSRGKTALHAAVRSRNSNAIVALLLCGADVNVVDICGRTALTCVEIKEYMSELSDLQHHIDKLIAFGMYVSDLNMTWYCESLVDDDVSTSSVNYALIERLRSTVDNEVSRTIKRCSESLEKMKDVKISGSTTLYRVFRDGAERLAYSPMKLREIGKIVMANARADNIFTACWFDLRDVLALMYRRACSRRKLLPVVENALQVLFKVDLPSPCCEAIVENLNDNDLVSVIEAVNFNED